MRELALQSYTAKASATQAVGTAYWPSSSGFDLNLVENPASFSVHVTDAGDNNATSDWSIEVYDGTNWMTDSTITFTQITSSAKKYVKVVAPTLWGKKVRVKHVVAVETSGASDVKFIYQGQAGAYTS